MRSGKRLARQTRFLWRDLVNCYRYGPTAPRFAELIWIQPFQCQRALPHKSVIEMTGLPRRAGSGIVVQAPWPYEAAFPVTEHPIVRSCVDHWTSGIPWDATPSYRGLLRSIAEKGAADGCRNMQDVRCRYERLDEIYEEVRQEGRLKTQREVDAGKWRESGGVVIHLGPEGEPFFAGGGAHRFAIALILSLPMPAQIGCVHHSALPYLPKLRCSSPPPHKGELQDARVPKNRRSFLRRKEL